MNLVTLLEIRTFAYRLADMEGATTRFPSSEVDVYVNAGIQKLWDVLIASRAWPWIGKTYWTAGTVSSSGTSPPVLTASGTAIIDDSFSFVVQINSIAVTTAITWQWSSSGANGTFTSGSTFNQAAGGTKVLGNTGVSIAFPIGTYAADNEWTFSISPLTTVSGVRAYELPSDFYKLHKVFASSSAVSTAYYEVGELPSNEEGQYRYTTQSAGGPEYYQIKAGTVAADYILLYPTPPANTSIQINYFPNAVTLSGDSSTIDDLGGWVTDYVPTYAAACMAMKDELFALYDRLQMDLQRIEKSIQEACRTRGRRAPRVQDVARSGDKWRRAWWQRGV